MALGVGVGVASDWAQAMSNTAPRISTKNKDQAGAARMARIIHGTAIMGCVEYGLCPKSPIPGCHPCILIRWAGGKTVVTLRAAL